MTPKAPLLAGVNPILLSPIRFRSGISWFMPTKLLAGLDILVVEDESLLRKQILAHLESVGADVTGVATLDAARQSLANLNFDFALLDVNLPDGRGTALLEPRLFSPNTGVIVMTAEGGISGAVDAMRKGALDYLVKPFEVDELSLVISRAQRTKQAARLDEHRRETQQAGDLFFGQALLGLQRQLERILAADRRMVEQLSPVLIEGETGTGKTSVARWLHQQGPRAREPLVEVNCSALPDTLAESELFGHERGAFTDARAARMGLFEAAHAGTLFLDDLPTLAPAVQAKVLKAIEDHRIRRLGGTQEIPVDARVIAATNQDLKQLVTAGKFREDLYHRLDLYRIQIPPLRERGADILELAEKLCRRLCRRQRLPVKPISAAGQRRLNAYAWPGNVRELAHELERAIVFEDRAELDFAHLLTSESPAAASAEDGWLNPAFRFPEEGFDLEKAIRRLIELALEQTNHNISAAARRLGVTRDYIRYRLTEPKKDAESSGK
jgi:DNA-binding NtrC family response regulator